MVLYGGGLQAAKVAPAPRAWHAVWVVFGLLFVYGTLSQFIELLDGDAGSALNVTWTFAVVAGAGVMAAAGAGVRFGWLVAGIALSVAWLAFWDELVGIGDSATTFRVLCMAAAGGLVAAAAALERRDVTEGREAAELVTAAGLIFVLGAGLISVLGGVVTGILQAVAPLGGAAPATSGFEPTLFWDLVLLVGSLALIGAGNAARIRGPVYVGALGLAVFVTVVGLDLDDDSPAGSIVGWPLLLLAAAALAVFASASSARRPPPG